MIIKVGIAVLGVIASVMLWASTAVCWHCPPRRCSFDLDCGLGCWCYRGEEQIELQGVCVSK